MIDKRKESEIEITTRNRDLIRRVYEIGDSGDLARLAELMSDDYTLTQAPGHPIHGRWSGQAATEAGGRVFKACGITGITVHEIIADGPNRVIGLVEAHGTDTEGQAWTMPVAECFWIENDKVTDIRPFYWDLVELRRIAGVA
jgi:ketosteroid isomerase-like protein